MIYDGCDFLHFWHFCERLFFSASLKATISGVLYLSGPGLPDYDLHRNQFMELRGLGLDYPY
jgi:hypothetical protein